MATVIAALVMCAPSTWADCPPAYEVAAIVYGPECWIGSAGVYPRASNAAGDVAGSMICPLGMDRAFLWPGEGPVIELPMPSGTSESVAEAIDVLGRIAGSYIPSGSGYGSLGFLYDGETFLSIVPPAGDNHLEVAAMNAHGCIVGNHGNTITGPILAYMWDDGEFTDLGPLLAAPTSRAVDVNDEGVIVGDRWIMQENDFIAFILDDGEIINLGSMPGGYASYAKAINSLGHVAGNGKIPKKEGSYYWRGFLYRDGEMLDLGTLPGYPASTVYDMNDADQIIGMCKNSELYYDTPFLWDDGVMYDLNDLLSPGSGLSRISYARVIDDDGRIAASGFDDVGARVMVVLAPAPALAGDVNCDGVIDVLDLLAILTSWGPCAAPPSACSADVNDDGIVDGLDLLLVLSNWGE